MLDQAQIDAFHRDGFLVMRGVVAGRELALLQDAAARVVADGIARRGADHLYGRAPDGREVYWRSERMWDRDPIFRAVTLNPAVLEAIGQCVGHEFFPWNDSLVVKTPGGGEVGWHQDPPYGDPARAGTYVVPNFTTDFYLDESDEDNGCVWAIPAHHLVGHVRVEDFAQDQLFAHPQAVAVRMRPGDVLFHSLSTPHGSRPNRSARMRRTFYVHYLAQEAHDQAGYRNWRKPWWSEDKRAQLARFAADRAALGLTPAYGPRIAEGVEGLAFTGGPVTPRRHWGELADRVPAERRAALQRLDAIRATAVAR